MDFCRLYAVNNFSRKIMKIRNVLLILIIITSVFLASCEGPVGPAGKDANETCKECHNQTIVDPKVVEFDFSKHKYGEAAFEEAGNIACAPCHESEGFKYVCANNIPATFTQNTGTGKYSNDYVATTSIAYGKLSCFTCHSKIHTTYAMTDFFPLTNTAAVSMTMWKGSKSINLPQDNGMSNLCVKCHQPRPLTTSSTISTGDIVDYDALASNPAGIFYDAAVGNAAPNKVIPSYRTHVHYGTVGAVYAGIGGVHFTGTVAYANSAHTSAASCKDCHMVTIKGRAGGHTFKMRSTEGVLGSSTDWNFNGCNVAGCHSTAITRDSDTFWKLSRNNIKTLLNSLAAKINAVGSGIPILHSESDGEANLWAGMTTGNFDGYLDIYDPSTNPSGVWKNPAPSGSWTQTDKNYNNTLQTFPSLKNVHIGALINFQLCLREYSLGIHNYKYSKALLQNSLDALTAAGY